MIRKLLILGWFLLLVSAFIFREKNPFLKLENFSSSMVNSAVKFRFKSGECIAQSAESWTYHKIHGVLNQDYQFSICEKFQGCLEPKFSFRDLFESKHRDDIVIPCP